MMIAFKLVAELWCWLVKHSVFPELVVTLIGVFLGAWLGFWLAGHGKRKALGKSTRQRLYLTVLEARHNANTIKAIFDTYGAAYEEGKIRFNVSRLDCTVAKAAFQDANVLSLLPLHKVSLLRTYMNHVAVLNRILEAHQGILGRQGQGYKTT